jgi:hypothetical protein
MMDSESDSEAPGQTHSPGPPAAHTGSGPGQPEAGASGRGRRFKHGWWTGSEGCPSPGRRAATAYTSKPRLGAAATESQPEADS